MEKVFNLQDLVPEIIKRLKNVSKSELPKGFLAGGSVSNTILSIIDNKEYPINDIDIFTDLMPQEQKTQIPRHIPIADGYAKTIFTNNKYKIVNSERLGMLNIVYIHTDNKTSFLDILSTFDINQTQVGIDLSTNKIYYTEHFIEFLKTRQLKMITGYTPFQTIIRLLEKSQYAYLNKELEIQKAIACLSTGYTNKISKDTKAFDLYLNKYRSLLDKYFYLIKDTNANQFIVYPKEFYTIVNNSSYVSTIPQVLDRIFYAKKNEKHFLNNLMSMPLLKHILFLNPNVKFTNISPHKLLKIETDMKVIENQFWYLLENFADVRLYQAISDKMSKEPIETIITLIEQLYYLDNVEQAINILNSDYDAKLKEPVDLSGFEYASNVKELTTLRELNSYSKLFKNCLYRYPSLIKSESSLVFVINYKDTPSVIEYKKDEYGFWKTIQHKGKQNTEVKNWKNIKIGKSLEIYLNNRILQS